MAKRLTNGVVAGLKPAETRFSVSDSVVSGLHVRVTPAGVKTFAVQYRVREGRRWAMRRVTLGQYPALEVAAARAQAKQILANVVANRADPALAKAARKTEITVEELGKLYLEDVQVRKKPNTAIEYERMWRTRVLPEFGHLCLSEVDFQHVKRWHARIRAETHAKRKRWASERECQGMPVPDEARLRQGGNFAADRALLLLSSFFEFAKENEYLPEEARNPARKVKRFEDPEKSQRTRFLTEGEAVRLGEAMMTAETDGLPPAPEKRRVPKTGATAKHRPKSAGIPKPADPYAIAAIRFLVLSGWRENEVLTLEHALVDFDAGRAKLRDAKRGPLGQHRLLGSVALALLAKLPRVPGSPYCFPSPVDPKKPLDSVKRIWYAIRHAAGLGDVRLHDLRHTFASTGSDGGEALASIGMLLGHRDLESTMRYVHAFDNPLRRSADNISSTIGQRLGLPPVTPRTAPLQLLVTDKGTEARGAAKQPSRVRGKRE